jgi:hypothetical protein
MISSVIGRVAKIGRRFWLFLDRILPGPPGEADWTGESPETDSARRKLRIRLHMLAKGGKGGYR